MIGVRGSLMLATCAMLAGAGACKSKDGAGDKPSPSAASAATTAAATGSAAASEACIGYQRALEACIKKAPDGDKQALQKTLELHRRAWDASASVQRAQMEDGCRMGLATLKQNPACQ